MKTLLILFTLFMILGCSKQVEEPYYDRAKAASEEAHQQLKKD